MYPVLARLGPLTLYSYGLMVALGFLAGIMTATQLAKRSGIKVEYILDLAVMVLVSSIIGARIFYVLEFYQDFISNPLSVFFIWQGGLVFFGGLLFAVIAAILFSRFTKTPLFLMLDIITPGTAIGYAIGRIGCFLNGCCYGIETNFCCAVSFPGIAGLRHPTQLYASLTWLILFGILLWVFTKKKFSGQVFSLGLVFYAVYRFLIEFIRTNPHYFYLSAAQWGSILLLILAIVLYFRLSKAGS